MPRMQAGGEDLRPQGRDAEHLREDRRRDALILGTPIYWYGPTAKMKLLIDRLRPYVANRRLEGKKAYLIAPSEEGPSACGPLVDSLKMSYKYLGLVYAGEALITANEKGEVAKKPEEMEKARHLLSGL